MGNSYGDTVGGGASVPVGAGYIVSGGIDRADTDVFASLSGTPYVVAHARGSENCALAFANHGIAAHGDGRGIQNNNGYRIQCSTKRSIVAAQRGVNLHKVGDGGFGRNRIYRFVCSGYPVLLNNGIPVPLVTQVFGSAVFKHSCQGHFTAMANCIVGSDYLCNRGFIYIDVKWIARGNAAVSVL